MYMLSLLFFPVFPTGARECMVLLFWVLTVALGRLGQPCPLGGRLLPRCSAEGAYTRKKPLGWRCRSVRYLQGGVLWAGGELSIYTSHFCSDAVALNFSVYNNLLFNLHSKKTSLVILIVDWLSLGSPLQDISSELLPVWDSVTATGMYFFYIASRNQSKTKKLVLSVCHSERWPDTFRSMHPVIYAVCFCWSSKLGDVPR